ncbi:hypothetical protein V6N13_090636 [Hibiscus sabdariffa]
MENRQRYWLSVVWFALIFEAFVSVSSQPLAVACGSKGGKDEDGRNWESDEKYLKSSHGSIQLQAGYQDPSLLSTIPYMNVRIFTSPAAYQFPIKSKQRYLARKGVPTYKDYAIFVYDGPRDEMVTIQMTPSTESKPQYYDSQLNGVEIFKLDDENKNLAGSNPQLSSMLLQTGSKPKKSFRSKSNNSVIAGAAGGAAASFLLIAPALYAYGKRRQAGGADSRASSWLPLHGNSNSNGSKYGKSNSSHASALAQGLSRHFSISEIRQATEDFIDSNVIGVGGFGSTTSSDSSVRSQRQGNNSQGSEIELNEEPDNQIDIFSQLINQKGR